MLTLTADQIRTLAPDASAARAGEGLADPRRWSDAGRTESAAWGLCRGSGSSPYQVAVDLGGPAYRCSCPSRKIPCKHALGLLFLMGAADAHGQPPEWVSTWLESRAARAEAAATRVHRSEEADQAARARRIESRERKVAAGIDELDRWLADLMRRGLDSARAEGYRFWDAMGARLVDAQAAGLGRSVRGLGSAASAGAAWPHLLLEGTARLHLLVEAYRRLEHLPEPLRADVRSLVGWTTKEDDLDTTDAVEDRWLVVGRRVDDSGQVITARTLVLGETSGRFALHLAFGVDMAPPTVLAMPGQAFRATLTYYPSATPLRAAVRPTIVHDGEVTAIPGAVDVSDVARLHAEQLARNPFLGSSPVALGSVTPVLRADALLVRKAGGAALPVVPSSLAARLLAVSGGHPVTVVGEWDGSVLRPLSVLADARLVGLDAPFDIAAATRSGDADWSSLLSAALLGTERAGEAFAVPEPAVSVIAVGERTREAQLLEAAGVLAVRRRAGRQPASDAEPIPDPAPGDERPAVAGEAARLVAVVLEEYSVLVPEVIGLIVASGRRPPDECLPELLAIASDDTDVRDRLAELGGPRGAWLAAQLPDLALQAVPTPGSDPDATWRAVRSAKHRADLVRAMRRSDPTEAREALALWLPDLPGEERAEVVEALEVGLGRDDEEFLAAALEDPRLDVRRSAAALLAEIDGSSFNRLVEARAQPLLSIHGRLRPRVAAELPSLDAELETAGFGGRPPTGLGERAWLLRLLLGHVRPARWTEWLGARPSTLVAYALRSGEARPILEGWAEAAARFADVEWLAALIAEAQVRATMSLDLRRLVATLSAERRTAIAARVGASADPATLAWLAALAPAIWPQPVTDAVLGAIRELGANQYPDQALYDLVRAAAVGLDPGRGDELTALASHDGGIRPALIGAIDTIRLRERMYTAFASLPPVTPSNRSP